MFSLQCHSGFLFTNPHQKRIVRLMCCCKYGVSVRIPYYTTPDQTCFFVDFIRVSADIVVVMPLAWGNGRKRYHWTPTRNAALLPNESRREKGAEVRVYPTKETWPGGQRQNWQCTSMLWASRLAQPLDLEGGQPPPNLTIMVATARINYQFDVHTLAGTLQCLCRRLHFSMEGNTGAVSQGRGF